MDDVASAWRNPSVQKNHIDCYICSFVSIYVFACVLVLVEINSIRLRNTAPMQIHRRTNALFYRWTTKAIKRQKYNIYDLHAENERKKLGHQLYNP